MTVPDTSSASQPSDSQPSDSNPSDRPQPPNERLPSEQLSPGSVALHSLSSTDVVALFDHEQSTITAALLRVRDDVARLGDAMADCLTGGGRIVYVGAGTSGRIGALDAAEWPPTFGVSPSQILALMAGGDRALRESVEGAEDDRVAARSDLEGVHVSRADLLIGISASGTAPYVSEAIAIARRLGAGRAFITSNPSTESEDAELIAVRLETGAEVLAGSTRLKAATVTHQVLQRASNVCAVRCGWVYAGRMVEMRPTNVKLRARAERIVAELCELDPKVAGELLRTSDDDMKVAIVSHRLDVTAAQARTRLDAVHRRLTEIPGF